jgi:hypothetical protein
MCGDLSVAKWKDRGKKSVVVISSLHNPEIKEQVLRTNKEGHREAVSCSSSIADYNRFMGGVDGFDQIMSTYRIEWKSRRWWIKLFHFLFDASITNAYTPYKTSLKLKNNHAKPMVPSHF